MRTSQDKDSGFVHLISDEKIAEFRGMSLRARLHWLEVANAFANKAVGVRKRALFDSRFEALIPKR
jgi:hypothetical protein